MPKNRRARFLNLEALENRQLLSVSPAAPPDPVLDTGQPAGEAGPYEASAALVSTMDPVREGDATADTGTAPTVTDDAFSITATQQLGAGVLVNDADADGDPLSVALQTDVSHGELTLGANGLFTYRPDGGFNGVDSFTYTVSDGLHDAGPATVTIEVAAIDSLPPQAVGDAFSLLQGQSLTVNPLDGVLANDNDGDGDPLSAVLVNAPSHGTLTLGADGSFAYTPEADFHGQDSFTYVANDGQAESALATVAITVEAVNDAPVSFDDAYTMAEDGILTVDATGGVLANDSDIDGDALTATLVDGPTHGTVTLGEDGSFEYTPEANFNGEDSFTYLASDGQAESNLATVAITVEAVNDAPVSSDDAYTMAEDGILTIDATAGVLANDTDIDGDALTASLVDGPAHGTVTLGEDGSFEYTPEANFHGQDSFTYLSSDGQADSDVATVTIDVTRSQLAVQLQISETPFGTEVDAVWAGATFWVSAFVEDLREVPAGVVGGAIDLVYDGLTVTPTGEVAYGDAFSLFQQGEPDADAPIIDEAGALAATPMVGTGEAAAFVSWQFAGDPQALATTGAQFFAEPGEGTSTIQPGNFALVGSSLPVDWSEVELGSAGIDLVFPDFNSDQQIDHFDLALWVPHAGSAAGDGGYDPLCDLDSSGLIDEADLDLLMSGMYDSPAGEITSPLDDGQTETGGEGLPAPPEDLASSSEDASQGSAPVSIVDDLFADESLWS